MAARSDATLGELQQRRTLGLFGSTTFIEQKATFWTDNPVGNALHAALLALAEGKILDHREDPDDQFRWSGSA